jgi:hypothetical protein
MRGGRGGRGGRRVRGGRGGSAAGVGRRRFERGAWLGGGSLGGISCGRASAEGSGAAYHPPYPQHRDIEGIETTGPRADTEVVSLTSRGGGAR